jgi:lipid II:glycine glycyltransferase (peptidoglycan interpeptide bridge formation enzyme)
MTDLSIQLIQTKENWEKFIQARPEANFLQSYNWGLFQQKLGKKFFSLGIFKQQQQIGAALVIKEEAKRGDYLTIAAGPLLNWTDDAIEPTFYFFVSELKKLAIQEKCHFVRIRPQAIASEKIVTLFKKQGLRPAPMHLTADLTLQLDLSLSDDELLKQMRKNTRYSIRKAQKEGIITKVVTDPEFMDTFHQHQLYLAEKHQFVPFTKEFLQKQYQTFLADDQVAFVNSYLGEELLASAFVIFYNQRAVYHYGISTPKNKHLPGSYATQWAAIAEAKKRGCQIYNLWGIAAADKPQHRFAGVSIFKRGFGGKEVSYLPAYDLPITGYYWLERGFELTRKKFRHL